MENLSPKSARRPDLVVLALLACSLALNLFLGARLWMHGGAVSAGAPTASVPSRPEPELGATLPPIECETLEGRRTRLGGHVNLPDGGPSDGTAAGTDAGANAPTGDEDRRPLVLYAFTTRCPWCLRNIPNIKALAAAVASRFRVAALALDTDREAIAHYVATNGLTLPVYTRLSSQTIEAYGLGSVPLTLVVSPEGKLLQRWRGAYTGPSRQEIEDFFDVSLPGLADARTARSAEDR